MLEHILKSSITHRWLVLIATLVVALFGVVQLMNLPVDAVPDITNVQVQVNAEAPGYSPLEVEQRITVPLEAVMGGLPHLQEVRSLSRYGLGQLTVIFKDGTDIYFARQLVNERIQEAREKLPEGVEVAMGPIVTGLGEIYLWAVDAESAARKPDGTPYSLMDLREIQDWIIKPQLRTVPGVAEINSIGGYDKLYQVAPDPDKLVAYGLTFHDLIVALERNNANVSSGYVENKGEQFIVRAPGQVAGLEDIAAIVVGTREGIPIRISDVATVDLGKELRTGAATQNGHEVVIGTAFMLIGENSRTVARAVDERMTEIRRTLPPGIIAPTIYDRTVLVEKTIGTVTTSLFEGAILVIAVLWLFLGNWRAAIVTALVIPLATLFMAIGMTGNKISANLMSLGALDFGLIVDGAVIIVENCIRRLSDRQKEFGRALTRDERFKTVFEASREVRQATMSGELIIMIVYLPILTLTGVEGKMFFPMAFTVLAALLGAMIFSMTFVPAMVAVFLHKPVSEKEPKIVEYSHRIYEPTLRFAMANGSVVLFASGMIVALSILMATRMGTEFIPSLDEGDVALHAMRIPGTSLTQAVEMQYTLEARLKQIPEVERIFAKIGTAEVANDPMPPNVADCFAMLKPRSQWPDPDRSKDDVVAEIEKAAREIPGNNYEFTQPIQMRFNELIAGVRSDVGVKVFGDDMDQLLKTAGDVLKILQKVPGAEDARVEQVTGLPFLKIDINRQELSRYGVNVADVQEAIAIAIGGKEVGRVFEGDRNFGIIVRLPDEIRSRIEDMKRIPIPLPALSEENRAAFVPLGVLAKFEVSEGPNQVSRENGKRRVVVTANVRDRDLGGFVGEAQRMMTERLVLPTGYWIRWGGQFEQLISAANRLKIVVPVALLLIFGLLFMTFGDARDALLVFSGVPLALTGGIAGLWIRGIPLSISAGVGFIALSGVAVLNGLVMITFIKNLREEGMELDEAIHVGAMARLRPVLMTALVASLGFVPMALATGTGSEVQRPLATVVIGGIISSTALTLIALPVLYRLAHSFKLSEWPKRKRKHQSHGGHGHVHADESA